MVKLLDVKDVTEFSFEELYARLRKVPLNPQGSLKEPDGSLVSVYKTAKFEPVKMSPEEVKQKLFTPQPIVYQERLDFLNALRDKFKELGYEDPLQLTKCYDFTSVYLDDRGVEKEELWTIMPPIIEVNQYPIFAEEVKGFLDYSEYQENLPDGHGINPELEQKNYRDVQLDVAFPIICDGFHRVAAALDRNIPVTVLYVYGSDQRFPYYGSPKPVSELHKLQSRTDKYENVKGKKEYVVAKPNHKSLYRHFPTAGIHCGGIRPSAKK